MASTYSTTLRLELIGQGDQSGTWGITTNTNFGSLVEQAITGVQAISMSNATYTLSNYNGAVDEARNAVLVLTGTNVTPQQLIAPSVEKIYIVTNGTGNTVTIKTSGGNGINVSTGTSALVYCDGTDFYSGLTGINGNLAITGNETVGGNITVGGNAAITGNVTVTGNITANSITGVTGRIIQVVNSTFTTSFSTTSSSFVSTGHTASITPTSTSSKIMCFVTAELAQQDTNLNTHMTLFRDSTNLAGSGNAFCDVLSSAGNIYANAAINYFDSPGTTSAISYSTRILVNGGTGIYNAGGTGVTAGKAVITLMEIL
jgi:hypothetical protein